QASGVGVNAQCLSVYEELKLGKAKKPKFVVFTLAKDLTEIIVEKTGEQTSTYDEFIASLPEAECRWAVYDFEYKREDGGIRNKLTFISWSPDDAKVKQKMLFASSKDALRRALVGIAVEIQGTDYSEIAEDVGACAPSTPRSSTQADRVVSPFHLGPSSPHRAVRDKAARGN
ncbi:recombinant Actophorin, partial [Epithele typhae]|uniref:recombinant Actophorin n=1 Tax=Epithele typhae TaxID=378194 RepID=UPI002007D47D